MPTLVADKLNRATILALDVLIQELRRGCHGVIPKCLCFDPLGTIIRGYDNVPVPSMHCRRLERLERRRSPESNLVHRSLEHNPLSVGHRTDIRVLVCNGPLVRTTPHPIVSHPGAQFFGPALLADLINYTHTSLRCVIGSDTTYIGSSSYIPHWNEQG